MAQPETPGVWTSATSGTQAFSFVDDLKHKNWVAMTLDIPVERRSDADGFGRVGEVLEGDGQGNVIAIRQLTGAVGAEGRGFIEMLFGIAGRYEDIGLPIRATFFRGKQISEPYGFRIDDSEAEEVDLVFLDNSRATAFPSDKQSLFVDERPLDHPDRLQESVSIAEYGSIEVIIQEFQSVLDAAKLDDDIRLRLQGAMDVLRGTHRAIVLDETERMEIVSAIKSVVRYLATQVPTGIVIWDKAIDVLSTWYPSIADLVTKLLRG